MSKRIKMVIYGEPGTGKSVFALHAPKPFFITTDGNYEWLEEFGAKDKDHKQVFSWEEMKKAFAESYDDYETIVVDLLEDAFKWCESEFCKKNKIEHVGDLGFAKGYDITRNEFFLEISKLLAKDKHIILISHGLDKVVKDRRGVEHTNHIPSTRIPDKVWDMIEGRVRYFLRCYLRGEDDGEGKMIKNRYLSLIPKENEYGITRGIDEMVVPHDIKLDFNEFANIIGLETSLPSLKATRAKAKAEEFKEVEKKIDVAIENSSNEKEQEVEIKEEQQNVEPEVVNEEPVRHRRIRKADVQVEVHQESTPNPTEIEVVDEPKVEQPKPEVNTPEIGRARMDDIKARIEALKAKKKLN